MDLRLNLLEVYSGKIHSCISFTHATATLATLLTCLSPNNGGGAFNHTKQFSTTPTGSLSVTQF